MQSKWMKRSLMAVLPVAMSAAVMVISTGVSSAQTATPWAATGSMNYAHSTAPVNLSGTQQPSNLDGGAEVLPNGRVFVTGDSSWKSGSAEVYNPSTGKFTTTTPMLYPVEGFAMTELSDGRILVTGGYRTDIGVNTNRTQIWNPSTGTWTETAASPSGSGGSGQQAVTLHNGQVLLLGSANAYLYNPSTASWTTAASKPLTYPAAVTIPAVVLPNGNVLSVQKAGPPEYLICAGGGDYHSFLPMTAELYQTATNTWKQLGPVQQVFGDGASATLLNDGTVLYAGGSAIDPKCPSNGVSTAVVYNPATDTWTQVGSMSVPRYDMSAVKLADGRVLIAGGEGEAFAGPGCHPTSLQSTWRVDIYNPTSKSFTAEPTMLTPRRSAVSALLPNGQALVAGGVDFATGSPGDPASCTVNHDLNEAELFTP